MKLLVLEQWHLGDLALASPFLQAASVNYDVSLVAKPIAADLGEYFWPGVAIFPFEAPWTAFDRKYDISHWPWAAIRTLLRTLRAQQFDVAVSARCDPRDHLLMALSGAKRRLGFARLGSHLLLTEPLARESTFTHRLSCWQKLASALGLGFLRPPACNNRQGRDLIVVHTGARRITRVWPLERYAGIVRRLRNQQYEVQVLCDRQQLQFWLQQQVDVIVPGPIAELIKLIKKAALFVGNDSGPGHIATICGIPTFTIFGPQLPELFAPVHPEADWIEGSPCPFKPCFDSCRFSVPHCLFNLSEEAVWRRVESFIARFLPVPDDKGGTTTDPAPAASRETI